VPGLNARHIIEVSCFTYFKWQAHNLGKWQAHYLGKQPTCSKCQAHNSGRLLNVGWLARLTYFKCQAHRSGTGTSSRQVAQLRSARWQGRLSARHIIQATYSVSVGSVARSWDLATARSSLLRISGSYFRVRVRRGSPDPARHLTEVGRALGSNPQLARWQGSTPAHCQRVESTRGHDNRARSLGSTWSAMDRLWSAFRLRMRTSATG
jgi:hypothetical protein